MACVIWWGVACVIWWGCGMCDVVGVACVIVGVWLV